VPRPAPKAPPATPVTRHAPTQRRSQERLARIARAAGELCAQLGAEAVTMEAIADRAETSIGSLYRFYPNRDALLEAVAERYVADLGAVLDGEEGAAERVAALPIGELVDAILEPFVAFHRAHPGYFAILFAPQGSVALRAVRGRLRQRLAARLEALLALRAPRLAAERRRRVALTTVEAARALLQFIERSVPRGEQAPMRQEMRALLVAYLGPVIGE
jgi:AcrR family transcriptional regulator